MPRWVPEPIWQDQDVFIIGGGPSLRDFDWSSLENEWTVGCNSAFTLGEKVCKVCIFGDAKWFKIYKHDLSRYKGTLFTSSPQLLRTKIPWLWTMERVAKGLHHQALGWNKNTGASAINLALLLGAKTIYLLGYDMHLSEQGQPNWHDRLIHSPSAENYPKFADNFKWVVRDLEKKWSNVKVWNVTDNSGLDLFPKIGVEKFWNERKKDAVDN